MTKIQNLHRRLRDHRRVVRLLGLVLLVCGVPFLMAQVPRPAPGALRATLGGTGLASYTIGDVLYADTSTSLAKLAAVASGQLLASAGTGTAPAWSKVPTLLAGGSTQAYHLGGTLYWENTNTGNAADTVFITTTAYALPAATMATNGDQLLVELVVLFDATASTKTVKCNLGYTSLDTASGAFTGGQSLLSVGTTGVSLTQMFRVWITRTSTTAGNIFGNFPTSTAASQSGLSILSGSVTWANANNLLCAASSSVSTANIVTLKELRVTWIPR